MTCHEVFFDIQVFWNFDIWIIKSSYYSQMSILWQLYWLVIFSTNKLQNFREIHLCSAFMLFMEGFNTNKNKVMKFKTGRWIEIWNKGIKTWNKEIRRKNPLPLELQPHQKKTISVSWKPLMNSFDEGQNMLPTLS